MLDRSKQKACAMNSETFVMFNELFKKLIIDECRDSARLFVLSNLSNAMKLKLLLSYLDGLVADE